MAKYKICGKCGAHIDSGEKCKCEEERWKEIEVMRSDTGLFFLYNSGGRTSFETIGRAQVLTGKNGDPLKCYSRIKGFNGDHALCRVMDGYYVVQVKEFSFGFPEINIYQIKSFTERNSKFYAVCQKIYRESFSSREYWDTPIETVQMLREAMEAAIGMSETIMCRKPCYVKMGDL